MFRLGVMREVRTLLGLFALVRLVALMSIPYEQQMAY